MIFNPGIMAATGAAGAVLGSYTGNGKTQKNLSLGFEPAAILIISNLDPGGNVHMVVAVNGAPRGLGTSSSSTYKTQIDVNFSGEGVLLGSPNNPNYIQFNQNNYVYNYIAIPKA